jgi:hypothetical protein
MPVQSHGTSPPTPVALAMSRPHCSVFSSSSVFTFAKSGRPCRFAGQSDVVGRWLDVKLRRQDP